MSPRNPHLRNRAPRPAPSALPPTHLVVRLQPGLGLPYADGAESELPDDLADDWAQLADAWQGISLDRVWVDVAPERIVGLMKAAEANDADYRGGRLLDYFRVPIPRGARASDLRAALETFQWVEEAQYDLRGRDPAVYGAVNTSGEDDFGKQGYFDPAPAGVDIRAAWTLPGGNGSAVQVVDVEKGWFLDHDEHEHLSLSVLAGDNRKSSWSHGVRTLGVLCAEDDGDAVPAGDGVVGGVPRCSAMKLVSYRSAAGDDNIPNAVLAALQALSAGDVMLLEVEVEVIDDGVSLEHAPAEIQTAIYEVVRLATALDVTVVAAAGNGNHDLDALADPLGHRYFDAASTDFRESGAILVGSAYSAGSIDPRKRYKTSNYGSRVDCFAWGNGVLTCNYEVPPAGAVPDTHAYAGDFNGTSAAGAVVAAAAGAVQSVARTVLGTHLSAGTLRELFRSNTLNTPSADPASDRIGVMPDLAAILTKEVGADLADVYVRGYAEDAGLPDELASGDSPDVIVVEAGTVSDAESELAVEELPDAAEAAASLRPDADQEIYVRVSNRGPGDAGNVTVVVYALPIEDPLPPPGEWKKLGETEIASVPAGGAPVVSPAIAWPAAELPPAGAYSFVALVGHGLDPLPTLPEPPDGGTTEALTAFLRNVNNAARRRFAVEALEVA